MFPSEINQIYLRVSSIDLTYSLAICLILCLLFTYPTIQRKWLTVPALLTTTIIAASFVFKLGLGILIYPFIFVFLGSLLSRKDKSSKEKNGRTTKQVLANSIIALCIVFAISNNQIAIPLVIFVFSIALSDTMSSEIGKKYLGKNYDICTFKQINHGLSGGISMAGTLGGLIGSSTMALASMLYSVDFYFFISVCVIGFVGMLLDSIIGSLAQGKYLIDHQLKEHGPKEKLVKGFHLFDNELTNFVSILLTITLVYLAFTP